MTKKNIPTLKSIKDIGFDNLTAEERERLFQEHIEKGRRLFPEAFEQRNFARWVTNPWAEIPEETEQKKTGKGEYHD